MTDVADIEPPTVAPPTRPLSILQSLRAARRNVLEVIPDLAHRQPMVSGRMGARWHMVQDPAALRRVFLDNVNNYPKSEVMVRMLRPAVVRRLDPVGHNSPVGSRGSAPFSNETISLPIGQSASPASFRCAQANGNPMIVIASTAAVIRCPSASHHPANKSQIRFPSTPSGPVPMLDRPVNYAIAYQSRS